jgi:small GTP-binding protein
MTTAASTVSATPAAAPRPRLEAIAARLVQISDELGLDALGRTIHADTSRRLDDDIVRALVLGEIKQGKSTLINAMLGREALPMGVTPTTGATVVVRAADLQGTFLVAPDGTRVHLDKDEFTRRAKGPAAGTSPPVGQLELAVDEVALPRGLELVDTPGINDIAAYRAAISRGELPRADILVLVLDATQLLNRTELAFLRDALSAVGGLQDSGARLLLVVNRIDLVGEDDRPKLREYLARELAVLAGTRESGETLETFETDARGALRDPASSAHGVVEVRRLRERLFALAQTRGEILPARVRASLQRHATLLSHNAAVAAHALSLEIETLRREIRTVEREWAELELDMTEVRTQMTASRDRLLAASDERLSQFRANLQTSTIALIGTTSLRMLASHLPGALHDAFLAFAQQEGERLREGLDELTRMAIHTHSEQVRRRLVHAALRFGFRGPTIYLDPPSVALEAGLVAIGLVGTAVMYFGNLVAGMLMTIAGPLATVLLREQSLRDARVRARAELPAALERASSAFQDSVRKVVDGHIAALDEHLLLANNALGEQLLGILRRAQTELDVVDAPATPEIEAGRRTKAQQRLHDVEVELHALCAELERVAV